MKIGIDARVLERKITGVGRYLINILNALPEYDKTNEYILLSKSKINLTDNFYKYLLTGDSSLPEKIYSFYWLNFVLPEYLKKEKIELFFTPNHLLPLKMLKNIKTATVVHDVFHKINKNYHPTLYSMYFDFFLPNSLKKSNLIITVSNNSKKDIVEIFNVPEEKVQVIYQYADEKFKPIQMDSDTRLSVLDKYQLPSNKILLYVGLIENRKNILGILKIGDILYSKREDFSILLIGREGFGFERIHDEIKKRSHFVKYLNNIDDETLKIIYNIAEVFIFPSYYEGFGLPPLEAMQTGIPVLASNTSSLVEVVGEGGILHAPDEHEAFAIDIERLLNNSGFYYEMKIKALSQAKKFTKENSIKTLIETFESF